MKISCAFFVAVLLAFPTMMMAAPTIDGLADTEYGSAIVTQQLGTTALDNTVGHKAAGSGSELDAAYGFISNGVLYLVIAGNLDSGSNSPPAVAFDKLHIFFQTGPGGQNILTNGGNYGGADFGRLNTMAKLKFDAGFAPNYWMNFTAGGVGTNPTFYANFARMRTTNDAGLGSFLGQSSPPSYTALTNTTVSGTSTGSPIIVAINNSNIVGVVGDTAGCQSNGVPYSPGTVRTGVELAIPVAAIGASTGNVFVCAFLTEDQCTNAYNQVLGPITGNSLFCQPSLGPTTNVDLSALPGQHYFAIVPPPCTFGLNPTSANYGPNGGPGSVSVVVVGPCPWSATSNVPWVTITSPVSFPFIGAGTVNYTVATNTTTIGRQGILTIAGLTFAVNQFGQPLGGVTIDGTAETNHYGCGPLAVQQIGTGFGDNSNGQLDTANGSELDAAYGVIENGVLYLVLSGNLENNFNKLELFFQTGPGGQNTLTNINPNVDFDGLNRMGAGCGTCGDTSLASNVGLTFDADFAPNYWVGVTCGGTPVSVFANYAQLWPGAGGSNGYHLGSTAALTNGTLFGGTNPFGIQATVNNINILGVTGDGCYDDPGTYTQGSIKTGVELGIPLAALGSPTGAIRVCALINGTGHNFLSNQILGSLDDGTHDGTYCPANLGEPTVVNLSTLPGQHYFVVGPEMRVTGITRTGSNINVSWLSAASSNLTYQLQRASTLTTSVWSNVGSPTNGTGAVITQTDTSATTNTAYFYRVSQNPLCP